LDTLLKNEALNYRITSSLKICLKRIGLLLFRVTFYFDEEIKKRSQFALDNVLFAVLLLYLSSYVVQETAKRPLRSSSQAITCYYLSNRSKVETPVKCLAQGHNKRTCRPIFTLSLFDAERQAGTL